MIGFVIGILDGSGYMKKKGTVLIALCVLCCLLAGAVVSCQFTETEESDEPGTEDVQTEEETETPPENTDEAELPETETEAEEYPEPEPPLWQAEIPIYRCDDVYRTDETPTHGSAVVTIPELPPEYEVRGCDVLLCDDGCDPTDVLSRAFWGYAPIFRVENYVEFGKSDGWAYPARRYDFTPPDDVAEDMRESGAPEYHIYSRKYLYLLTVDQSHYAYFEIQAKDEEAPKPDGEEETVDEIVKKAVIELDTSSVPLPVSESVPPVGLDEGTYVCPAEFTGDWYHSYAETDGTEHFYQFEFDTENRTIRFADGIYESEYGGRWFGSFTVHRMTNILSAFLHDERDESPHLTLELELSYHESSEEGRYITVRFLDCNVERYASLIGQTLTFTDEPAVPAYVPVEYDFPSPENFDFNWSMYDAATQEFVGYTVNGKEGAAYYNCVTDRYITGFDYEDFEVCGRYLIARQSRYDVPAVLGNVHNVVLDSVTGQLLYDFVDEERASPSTSGVSFLTSGAGIFFRNENGWPYFDLYTEDFRLVGQFWFGAVDEDGNFVGSSVIPNGDGFDPGKSFFVYSPAGELLRESREYDEILFVNRGLVLVNDGGRIRLLDSAENLLADYGEWNDDLYMHWQISGYAASGKRKVPNWETEYYTLNGDGSYTPAEEPEVYPPCCWFTIEDSAIPYGTMGSGKEYLYYPETGEAAVLWTIGVVGYAKPVLYLYPEEETDVTVTFARPDALTTTYPKYESAWEVSASPDGTLTDERGRHYYALYWEERGYLPVDFREGYCVAAADAASFLEEKLGVLGLTEREANEFILYWLPVMEHSPYSLVYFELTESRQAWNGLTISPEPDSLLRIAMHVRGADEPAEMREQRLPSWERTGFSAVEWGGVAVP